VQRGVVRPERVEGVQMGRLGREGEFEVIWRPVERASGNTVVVRYPSGTGEVGDPCLNVRGEREAFC
jgi:hypothetical protein